MKLLTYLLIVLPVVKGWPSTNELSARIEESGDSASINSALLDVTNRISTDLTYCISSDVRSNLVVVFSGKQGSAPEFPLDMPISVGFSATTNYAEIFRLAPEYAFKLSAQAGDGKEVRPTGLGEQCGRNFAGVKAYDRGMLDWSGGSYSESYSSGKISWRIQKEYAGGRPFWVRATTGLPMMKRLIPPPQELFEFEKPGIYTLSVEYQCFARFSGLNSTNFCVVRFPAVKVQVQKY